MHNKALASLCGDRRGIYARISDSGLDRAVLAVKPDLDEDAVMVQFSIQSDSEIPASVQLFNQISFAIASGQFPSGYRLPSTRQLAMQTGLHRNTISKVYERLEAEGLVEAQVGSGIYVRGPKHEGAPRPARADIAPIPPQKLIAQVLDQLLQQGYSLAQIRELLAAAVEARLQAGTQVLVTVPQHDRGAGDIIVQELQQALSIPIQLVLLEELAAVLAADNSATVVTVRYFASQAEAITGPHGVRLLPIDIYDYSRELEIIKKLPPDSCLGLVSLSSGTLGVAEVMVHSLRGEDLFVMTAQAEDPYKLQALVHNAHTIITDQASFPLVKTAVAAARDKLIRPPQLVCCESYIDSESIKLLKRELGL